MEKKKNSIRYIIPPSYFRKTGIEPIKVSKQENPSVEIENRTQSISVKTQTRTPVQSPVVSSTPKIVLNKNTNRRSGLSLSSIRTKKEHIINKKDETVDEENLPREPFTEEELIKTWNTFVNQLHSNRKHILASILSIDTPRLKGTTIHLEFPTDTNKIEVERQQYDLMNFIRKTLKNYDISLEITVNETMEKKFVYTPDEKYELLKNKNPNLELLRKTFDLGI